MKYKKQREKLKLPAKMIEEVHTKGKSYWNVIDKKGKVFTVKAGSIPVDKPFSL